MKAGSAGGNQLIGAEGWRGGKEEDKALSFSGVTCSLAREPPSQGTGSETPLALCSASHVPCTGPNCLWKGPPFLVHKLVPPGPVLALETWYPDVRNQFKIFHLMGTYLVLRQKQKCEKHSRVSRASVSGTTLWRSNVHRCKVPLEFRE